MVFTFSTSICPFNRTNRIFISIPSTVFLLLHQSLHIPNLSITPPLGPPLTPSTPSPRAPPMPRPFNVILYISTISNGIITGPTWSIHSSSIDAHSEFPSICILSTRWSQNWIHFNGKRFISWGTVDELHFQSIISPRFRLILGMTEEFSLHRINMLLVLHRMEEVPYEES